MAFELDPRLSQDSEFVCDLPLCQVRLHNNAAFPWVLLIPRRENKIEIIDLDEQDQLQLFNEIKQISHLMKRLFEPKKLNIANLGNIVSQLHMHVIARYETDGAWPNPVWNSGVQRAYLDNEKQKIMSELQERN